MTAQPTPDPSGRFGRIQHHDPNNRAYPVRGFLFGDDPLITRNWYRRGVYDQGNTSSCTTHAFAGLRESSPFRLGLPRPGLEVLDTFEERVAFYQASKEHDPWPGTSYDGTSTDAPFRLARDRGLIREWRWAFGIDDVARTLSHFGPVCIGIAWRAGMMQTNDDGFIEWKGDEQGGHAVELVGYNHRTRTFTGLNSWGESWGRRGRFRMSWDDLDAALRADGEAATAVL